jgi:hypothetical protein
MAQTYRGAYFAGHITMALCLAASPVLAEEVMDCVDTQSVGFVWDKAGKVRQRPFTEDRYRVEVLSDTQRIITPMVGDTAGHSDWYICHTPYEEGEIACEDGAGTAPWLFHRNTYTRAFLLRPPGGGGDPNIGVAYGTCTGF